MGAQDEHRNRQPRGAGEIAGRRRSGTDAETPGRTYTRAARRELRPKRRGRDRESTGTPKMGMGARRVSLGIWVASVAAVALALAPAAAATVEPYGTHDAGGFRNVLPPGAAGARQPRPPAPAPARRR